MAQKQKKKYKSFWKNFKFKYKLVILNEDTLEELVGLHVSKLNGISVLLSILTVLFLIASSIIAFTPLRNYLPGYMNSEVRTQIIENALKVDSITQAVHRQNLYISNIQDIFSGAIAVDSITTMDSLIGYREDTLMKPTAAEEQFRRQYEDKEKYNITSLAVYPEVNGLLFYPPTRGLIAEAFDEQSRHLGVDIVASPNASVLAVLSGTVVLSNYTAESGYVLIVQHSRNFMSVYKHCGSLLKHEGDKVTSGEAIALVGRHAGTHTTSPHLHFELWCKGKALDPEKYIIF